MAEQFSLIRHYDFLGTLAGSVSLINNTDGFEVAYDGWVPKTVPDKDGRVREAITLRARGTSTDHLASQLQKIADKSYEASLFFNDPAEQYAVWMRVQANGETGARQSLVYSLNHQAASSVYSYAMRQLYRLPEYTLGIERAAWWESRTPTFITRGTPVSLLGGTFAYPTVGGDLPARPGLVVVTDNGSATPRWTPNTDLWMGFRSNRFGSANAFVPHWRFRGGFTIPGGGSIVADALANTGTALVWSNHAIQNYVFMGGLSAAFAAGTLAPQQGGEFLVLGRVKMSGTNAGAVVQLKSGLASDFTGSGSATMYSNARVYPRVPLTAGTVYKFYELGVVNIPGSNLYRHSFGGDRAINTFALLLHSQTTAGTPTISVDGFYLIPTECLIIQKSLNIGAADSPGVPNKIAIHKGPDERQSTYVYRQEGDLLLGDLIQTDTPLGIGAPSIAGGIPPGDSGIVVIAGQNASFSNLNSVAGTVEIQYYKRWKEMRGSD